MAAVQYLETRETRCSHSAASATAKGRHVLEGKASAARNKPTHFPSPAQARPQRQPQSPRLQLLLPGASVSARPGTVAGSTGSSSAGVLCAGARRKGLTWTCCQIPHAAEHRLVESLPPKEAQWSVYTRSHFFSFLCQEACFQKRP